MESISMSQSNMWDLGRFVKTLSYFGAIPILSSIDWFQAMLGSRPDPKVDGSTIAPQHPGVILVAGATGGVGRRVVQRLVQRGYRVRSLVRDVARAKTILGEGSELVEADFTIPETLTSAITQNLSAVICCTGTRVQPVEGDTPNREKYYQGIKFYLPEVVDVPEVVEYQGLQNLVQAIAPALQQANQKVVFDFTQPSSGLQDIWGAIDDVVMGGVSESNIRLHESVALFSGTVSTANSGGFASVRTRTFDPPLNLSGYAGIVLRVKGDGNRYKFMLRTETDWDGVAYCRSFDTVADTWLTVQIPFSELVPIFRAKTVVNAKPLEPSCIRAVQLMLSKFEYDGALNPAFTPGSFQLQVDSIAAYRAATLPQFVLVSSAGVTRPGRPGLNLDEEPPAVRMNEQLGGILTWKLRGEEVVRQSGLSYTIVRPCALTEEPGNQPLWVDQGDNLRGKVSREDIAELCIQALSQPHACQVTFEVTEGHGGCGVGDWDCLFAKVRRD